MIDILYSVKAAKAFGSNDAAILFALIIKMHEFDRMDAISNNNIPPTDFKVNVQRIMELMVITENEISVFLKMFSFMGYIKIYNRENDKFLVIIHDEV